MPSPADTSANASQATGRPERRERSGRAAASGVATAAFGLALGELYAATRPAAASPIITVGNAVVDRVPVGLKNLAISLFGVHDKLALLIGMGATIALAAAMLGVVTARRRSIGLVGFVCFGALGALGAALSRASIGRADSMVAAAVATIGCVAATTIAFPRRTNEASRRREPSEIEGRERLVPGAQPLDPGPPELLDRILGEASMDEQTGSHFSPGRLGGPLGRRGFVLGTGSVAVAALAAGQGSIVLRNRKDREVQTARKAAAKSLRTTAPAIANAGFAELDATTPYFTPNRSFYRIDTALVVPRVDTATWALSVEGLVKNPLRFTYDDLLQRDLVERDITLTCVSNEVGGQLMGNARWTGVLLRDLLDETVPETDASQIVGRSVDGWTSGFPTEYITAKSDAMVALAMNGEPLPTRHGFPARLIIPGLYGYVSATKWLKSIELTTLEAFDAYWVPRGYSKEAPIKLASRIDVPRGLATVPAGRTAIAGVAWAQPIGISGVEVQIDGGDWLPADLAPEQSTNTWRPWRLAWDATPGRHEITVRATDRNGNVQTEARVSPLPNGATGWHQIIVLVAG